MPPTQPYSQKLSGGVYGNSSFLIPHSEFVLCASLRAMSANLTPGRLRRIASDFHERFQPGRVLGALVAGSGLEMTVPGWKPAEEIDLDDLLPFSLHALMGHRQTATLWRRADETLIVFNGRFHLYQGYRPEEVVAPIRWRVC